MNDNFHVISSAGDVELGVEDGVFVTRVAGVKTAMAASAGVLTATGDVTISADSDSSGAGAIVFKTHGGTQRGQIDNTGNLTINGSINTQSQINIKGTIAGGISTAEPILQFWSDKNDTYADWQIGLDVANSVNGDFYIGKVSSVDGSVGDFIYCVSDATFGSITGVGITPPFGTSSPAYAGRLQVSARDGTAGHGLVIRVGPGTTGDALRVLDSASNILLSISSTGALSRDQNGIHVQAIANNGRLFSFDNVGGTVSYGLYYPTNGGATFIRFRDFTAGQDIWTAGSDNFVVSAPKVGFYNGAAATKGSITGALSTVTDAAAKAVLTSIITALTNISLVSNGTT